MLASYQTNTADNDVASKISEYETTIADYEVGTGIVHSSHIAPVKRGRGFRNCTALYMHAATQENGREDGRTGDERMIFNSIYRRFR